MDIAILGMGLPAVYVASRLAAEGLSVTLLGNAPDMVIEPVALSTIREFALQDFVMNELKFVARFDEDFRLRETPVQAATVSVERLHWHYLRKAMEYGCEVLAGSDFRLKPDLRITWRGARVNIKPELVIVEQERGKRVTAALAGRMPFNQDTVEFYDSPDMWVVPMGKLAVVGGDLDVSWHRFESAAFLRAYQLSSVLPVGRLVDDVVRLGRAAGHTSAEGFVVEPSLYHARLLVDVLLSGDSLKVYEKRARNPPKSVSTSLQAWLS